MESFHSNVSLFSVLLSLHRKGWALNEQQGAYLEVEGNPCPLHESERVLEACFFLGVYYGVCRRQPDFGRRELSSGSRKHVQSVANERQITALPLARAREADLQLA